MTAPDKLHQTGQNNVAFIYNLLVFNHQLLLFIEGGSAVAVNGNLRA